ncbi:MAG: translation initiation factor IF-2 [Lentisphaerae bacterium]|nr:translation initiation factor IF-2 [Lentisphaerota bacterium]
MRMYELAKELNVATKELMDRLRADGEDVTANPSANASVTQVRKARAMFGAAPAAAPGPEPVAAVPVAEPVPAPAEPPPPPEPSPAASLAAAPAAPAHAPEPEKPSIIRVREPIIVKELAVQLGLKPNVMIAELMRMNVFASINERLEFRVAHQLGLKHGIRVEHEKKVQEEKPAPPKKKVEAKPEVVERPEELIQRPPVVTFMGHVDHGKTSLLDHIRKTKVVAGEAGGITQHMGAYMVQFHDRWITFIDTPGHAAFTQMRARGANVTDIAVIVISAEEGIKPQTLEAIQHARAANVTTMCALNKIDLPGANIDRVKGQLQQNGLTPDDWGGTTVCVPVSAATGQGIDDLLEMILLQSEMLDLKAVPRRRASGFVLEARMAPGSGPVATVLVKSGTLQVGDAVVCGDYWGRVKSLENDRSVRVRTAGPSFAVQMLGLTAVPEAGSEFSVVANDREAKQSSEEKLAARRLESLQAPRRGMSLDDLLTQTDATRKVELSIVLKSDVQGTLEAIQQALSEIKSQKVSQKVILTGVGNISANDVLLAKASNAIIIGFHVANETGVEKVAKREGVEIRHYSIIYELIDEVRNAMAGLLEPVIKEIPLGQAMVKQVFQLSKKGAVAGCIVRGGKITSRARARVRRQGDVIFEGALASLKRFQNDASEVRDGQECGIRLDNFGDYQAGDLIEAYDVQKIAQEL